MEKRDSGRYGAVVCALLAGLSGAACSDDGGSGGGAAGSAGASGAGISGGGSGNAGGGGSSTTGGTGGSAGTGFAYPGCKPSELSLTESSSLAKAVVIDGNYTYLRGIQGKGSDLYVLVDGALSVVKGDASTATSVATGLPDIVGSNSGPSGGVLRVTDTHAYYATSKGISRVELATGMAQVVYAGLMGNSIGIDAPDYVEVDGDTVYFAVGEQDKLYSVPAAGGEAKLLNEGLGVQGMVVKSGFIYVADFTSQSIQRLPVAGGTPEAFGPPSNDLPYIVGLTATDSSLYWVDKMKLKSVDLAAPTTVKELGRAGEGYLVAAGDRVYWEDDSVCFSAIGGSGCTTVVYGDFPSYAAGYGLTDQYVYVAAGSQLLRVAK